MPDRCMRFCRQEIDLLYLLSSTPVCQCAGKKKKQTNEPARPSPKRRTIMSGQQNQMELRTEAFFARKVHLNF